MGRPHAHTSPPPVEVHARAAGATSPTSPPPPPRGRRRLIGWRLGAMLVVPVLGGPLARAARALWARRAALAAVRGAHAVSAGACVGVCGQG